MQAQTSIPVARVNGVPLHQAGEMLDDDTLRQRACTELLKQAAGAVGTTDASVADTIERFLDRELRVPEPSEDACLRHFQAHAARYGRGERVRLRHVLLAVTPGLDVAAMRRRAEALLLELRCADPDTDAFAAAARRWSNCPSGADGGELGWVSCDECAPEFAQGVFGQDTIGVLPRLVHSRHGLHVVEILEREAPIPPQFEEVREAVAARLRQQAWVQALRQYLQVLAAGATLEGVTLAAAESPLVQ